MMMIGSTGSPPKRVIAFGASGTIGEASVKALAEAGHEVVCILRPQATTSAASPDLAGAQIRWSDISDPMSVARDAFRGETFDVVLSCIASRTGVPDDAWLIDHQANMNVLNAAETANVSQMILLSAICVQKPRLQFQHAKLAFEKALIESRLTYSIVRPTAYFKSLSGQIDRVRCDKPFLLFGDGKLTACKPISNRDLARYLVDCISDENRHNAILPIGGPGAPITPLEQAERLFALSGKELRIRHIPIGMLSAIIAGLTVMGLFSKRAADKAELARIGRYYATESMLVFDPQTGEYSASATPSTGADTLFDFYTEVIAYNRSVSLGDHSVFDTM